MTNSGHEKPENPTLSLIPIRKKWLRRPGAFYMAPVPHEFYQLIGAVIIFWSFLEPTLDNILEALLAETNQKKTGWRFLSFRQRTKLLREAIASAFGRKTKIKDALDCALSAAVKMQGQRNLLVHGQYIFVFPKKGPGRLEVTGKLNRRIVRREFTADDLEKLYHEIGMLIGDLGSLFDPNDPHPQLSSQDRQTLQDILRRHLNGATQPTPQRPPQPSET